MEEPPIAGHRAVTRQQAVNADKALFRLIGAETRLTGIKILADGTRPMDVAMKKLMRDDRVLRNLHQLPSKANVASAKVKVEPSSNAVLSSLAKLHNKIQGMSKEGQSRGGSKDALRGNGGPQRSFPQTLQGDRPRNG